MYVCYYGWKAIACEAYLVAGLQKYDAHKAGDSEWLIPGTWKE